MGHPKAESTLTEVSFRVSPPDLGSRFPLLLHTLSDFGFARSSTESELNSVLPCLSPPLCASSSAGSISSRVSLTKSPHIFLFIKNYFSFLGILDDLRFFFRLRIFLWTRPSFLHPSFPRGSRFRGTDRRGSAVRASDFPTMPLLYLTIPFTSIIVTTVQPRSLLRISLEFVPANLVTILASMGSSPPTYYPPTALTSLELSYPP